MSGKKIQVTLPRKIVDNLEKLSKEKGLTKSILITLALEEYVKMEGNA